MNKMEKQMACSTMMAQIMETLKSEDETKRYWIAQEVVYHMTGDDIYFLPRGWEAEDRFQKYISKTYKLRAERLAEERRFWEEKKARMAAAK